MTREETESPSWVTLSPDERIIWQDRPSHWVIAKELIIGSIVVGIGIVGIVLLPGLWLLLPSALVLIGAIYAGVTIYKHRKVRYLITSTELYKKTGVFSKSVINLRLDRIQNTSFDQTFYQRLLGYGTVHIETAGTDGTDLVLESVNNPEHVMGRITECLEKVKSPEYDIA
ncbi:PH domain-containing protein [Halocatena marina]|uniref:PH domain-containing protein n=1 Tax=Halocatena marina TaxID=2934937 RepID=A0ABD5YQN8_9EURY|nr:PH domain-containing protein [Halocatena marina]